MLDIDPIEHRVMQMLLAGEHPTLETLRQQFDRSSVSERDDTGVGFFTSFRVRGGYVSYIGPLATFGGLEQREAVQTHYIRWGQGAQRMRLAGQPHAIDQRECYVVLPPTIGELEG